MIKKKAKGKGKVEAEKASAKKQNKTKEKEKEVDLEQVRKSIKVMVTDEFQEITQAAVDDAKKGQLATLKYLFEMTGVYPASTDDSGVKPEDDTLARTLLERLNIPFGPLPAHSDDEESVKTAPAAKENAQKDLPSEDADSKAEALAGNGE